MGEKIKMAIIKTGRKSFEINPSVALNKLLKHEQVQLAKNRNAIFENTFLPGWVHRTCPKCFKIMSKLNNIFKCKKCGLVKVPTGTNYTFEVEI